MLILMTMETTVFLSSSLLEGIHQKYQLNRLTGKQQAEMFPGVSHTASSWRDSETILCSNV